MRPLRWLTPFRLADAAGCRRAFGAARRCASAISERPAGHLGVQQFDHPAVELDHALAGVFRQGEGVDDGAGVLDLGDGRREHLVADVDLARVDQRLAVEAHVAALLAFRPEAVEVLDVVVDAVDDVDAVGARRDDAIGEPGGHGRAARRQPRARLLGEIVEAHHQHGEPRGRVGRDGGDLSRR